MKTLADMILHNARLHGDRVAIIDGERQLTHRALADQAARLAPGLRGGYGLKPQDRFLVLSKNRMEVMVPLAASALSGFILVPLNWRLAAAAFRHFGI